MQFIAVVQICICVYFTSLLCKQSGDCIQIEVCVYHIFVTERKCAGNTFIMEQSTSPVKQQKKTWSVTVLLEFLDFYLLLYMPYSW
jgi:hypothetical protein